MSIQDEEELFASNEALILVNEENTLAAVAVEPKRSLLCESVNVGWSERVVDERRLAAPAGAFEEEGSDVTPNWRRRDELLKVLDPAVDAYIGGWVDSRCFLEGAAGADDLEDSRERRLGACNSSSSENGLSESPRSVSAGVVLEAVVDGGLNRATTFFEMGTSSKERTRLVAPTLVTELKEALVVVGACVEVSLIHAEEARPPSLDERNALQSLTVHASKKDAPARTTVVNGKIQDRGCSKLPAFVSFEGEAMCGERGAVQYLILLAQAARLRIGLCLHRRQEL